MKEEINWSPEKDIHTKSGEIEVHNKIYQHKHKAKDFESKQKRVQILTRCEEHVKKQISGRVLDIGCGNGYASIHVSNNRDVDIVHSMECNQSAVDLIKDNYNNNEIKKDKYEVILGSFNQIPNKSYYDFIISLGVMHHSSNLLVTTKELYSSLSPGGYVFAHEPTMDDFTPNSVYINKEDQYKSVQNIVRWKESERDDHFFRDCEWITSFHHSGFDIVKYQLEPTNKPKIKNAIIVLKKPEKEINKIPHTWT